MIAETSYRKAFFAALFFHVALAIALLIDTTSHQRPVMTPEARNTPSQGEPSDKPQQEIVKAETVDNQEVMKTVARLKQERANQQKAEQARQQNLAKQAERARQARVQEQQRLTQLKQETEKLAIARKKQIEEEQRHLKQLTEQKVAEAKALEELKSKQQQLVKKQQEESQKLAVLKQKQAVEAQKDAEEKNLRAKAELAEKARQAAAQMAAENARSARIAGEVNKYKAMIVNAIGRQWILPENVDNRLSSQFRIRLAPDGAVLEVSLMRSSGDAILDRSAQTAIYKASPLPVPHDPATFDLFRDISLTVRPENIRG
ncbi:MAG: cell envelope integrity protein TolA [Tatlockia sp.]|jgi:colicin import membrane protein